MRSFVVATRELRLHGLRWDEASSGGAVLLLHGLASNARIWEKTAPLLAAGGLAPVAVDLRGHGLSDKPDGGYDVAMIARDMQEVVDGLGLQSPLLVGHSWGATLALHLAGEGFGACGAAAGLVLVDGGLTHPEDLPAATWERVSELLAPPKLAGLRKEELVSRLTDRAHRWVPDAQSVDITLANFEVLGDGTVHPRLSYDHHMQLLRSWYEYATYDAFARVRCPVLAVMAKPPQPRRIEEEGHLLLIGRSLDRARQVLPQLEVSWMEDSIHDLPLQRPRELAERILAFATRLPSAKAG